MAGFCLSLFDPGDGILQGRDQFRFLEGFLPVDIVMHAAAGFPVVHDAARHFTLCIDRMHDEVALHIIGFAVLAMSWRS